VTRGEPNRNWLPAELKALGPTIGEIDGVPSEFSQFVQDVDGLRAAMKRLGEARRTKAEAIAGCVEPASCNARDDVPRLEERVPVAPGERRLAYLASPAVDLQKVSADYGIFWLAICRTRDLQFRQHEVPSGLESRAKVSR
jgi:hypothetical protein